MLGSSFRCCCSQKLLSNQGVIGFGNNKIVCMCVRNTCDDKIYKKSCCKDIVQTDGRKVEVWPKSSTGKSAPGYRCDCPREQPATYDPYRIRVPEVMVPPLPPSNAKWPGDMVWTTDEGKHQNQPEQNQWQSQPTAPQQDEEKVEGFFGMIKKIFRGPKPKEPEGPTQQMIPHYYDWLICKY